MKMLFLWLLLLMVSFNFKSKARAEEAEHGVDKGGQHNEQAQRQSKLSDYVSACLAGRPLTPAVGALDFQAPGTTPGANGGAAGGGAGGDGRAIFQNACLKCHGPGGTAKDISALNASIAANAIERINKTGAGKMPKDRDLSDQEKQALTQYLSSVK